MSKESRTFIDVRLYVEVNPKGDQSPLRSAKGAVEWIKMIVNADSDQAVLIRDFDIVGFGLRAKTGFEWQGGSENAPEERNGR